LTSRNPIDGFPVSFAQSPPGARIVTGTIMTMDVVLGWWLACAVHPYAAWRRLRPAGRARRVGTYFGLGYVGALMVLLAA
jgi:hypothetical protein